MAREVKPKSFPTTLLDKDWSKRSWSDYFLPTTPSDHTMTDAIHDMDVREDDVFVVTLPKSGTTWMIELVWLVMNDFNFERAKCEVQERRGPCIDTELFVEPTFEDGFRILNDLKSPRILKTHRPLHMLPQQVWNKKPKLISLVRDPRDIFVSLYHFNRNLGTTLNLTLEEFLRQELDEDKNMCLMLEHALEFYALRHEPWIYYTSYERMKHNLHDEILSICNFLNKPINDDQMERILKHLSFTEMQKNSNVQLPLDLERLRAKRKVVNYKESKLCRKGKMGSYKEEILMEVQKELNQRIENTLTSHNITLNDLLILN